MWPKGVAGLWGRGTSRWSCIPRMPCFDLWLDEFYLFRIWVNRIKYKGAHARYRYKITAGFYFIHFQVGWETDNTLTYSCLLPSATKLRMLYFHRRVSVHRGRGVCSRGVGGSDLVGSAPGGVFAPGGLVSQHALRQTPPAEMAAAADGTHPTGMHSCFA